MYQPLSQALPHTASQLMLPQTQWTVYPHPQSTDTTQRDLDRLKTGGNRHTKECIYKHVLYSYGNKSDKRQIISEI